MYSKTGEEIVLPIQGTLAPAECCFTGRQISRIHACPSACCCLWQPHTTCWKQLGTKVGLACATAACLFWCQLPLSRNSITVFWSCQQVTQSVHALTHHLAQRTTCVKRTDFSSLGRRANCTGSLFSITDANDLPNFSALWANRQFRIRIKHSTTISAHNSKPVIPTCTATYSAWHVPQSAPSGHSTSQPNSIQLPKHFCTCMVTLGYCREPIRGKHAIRAVPTGCSVGGSAVRAISVRCAGCGHAARGAAPRGKFLFRQAFS